MIREEMRDRVRRRLEATDPFSDHLTDAAVDAVWPEVERLTEERDLAVAHDRQPYPTQWAYDQACAALEKQRQRAEQAEAERDAKLKTKAIGRAYVEMRDFASRETERAERAEAKLQAVAVLLADWDLLPGDAYIPIGPLRDAAGWTAEKGQT